MVTLGDFISICILDQNLVMTYQHATNQTRIDLTYASVIFNNKPNRIFST